MDHSAWIKAQRIAKGWSQQELATRAGVNVWTLRRMEAGQACEEAQVDMVRAALRAAEQAPAQPPRGAARPAEKRAPEKTPKKARRGGISIADMPAPDVRAPQKRQVRDASVLEMYPLRRGAEPVPLPTKRTRTEDAVPEGKAPVRVADMPAPEKKKSPVRVADSPALEKKSPVRVADSPALEKKSPVRVADSPALEKKSPVRVADMPAPEEKKTPVRVADSHAPEEKAPVRVADMPAPEEKASDSLAPEKPPIAASTPAAQPANAAATSAAELPEHPPVLDRQQALDFMRDGEKQRAALAQQRWLWQQAHRPVEQLRMAPASTMGDMLAVAMKRAQVPQQARVLDVVLRTDAQRGTLNAPGVTMLVHTLEEMDVSGDALMRCDARRMPFADETFDAVLIRSALHSVAYVTQLVREARRVLKRGGRLVLCDQMADAYPRTARMQQTLAYVSDPQLVQLHSIDAISSVLCALGMQVTYRLATSVRTTYAQWARGVDVARARSLAKWLHQLAADGNGAGIGLRATGDVLSFALPYMLIGARKVDAVQCDA
nr:methyltransferase domain-containing protein [Maliibacterium massiliense]